MGLGHDWWILMMVVMAAFWALVIPASIWVLHSLTADPRDRGETAVEELDRRLARGEISADEYRERRDALDPELQD
jgi:putative membrane protein